MTRLIPGDRSVRPVPAQTHKFPDEVYQIARTKVMRGSGITVDFAPDVDVTAAADDTVIGWTDRFRPTPTLSPNMRALARGLRDAASCRCSALRPRPWIGDFTPVVSYRHRWQTCRPMI